jgi:hypothetical protein
MKRRNFLKEIGAITSAIATAARERGYTPGELFRFEENAQVVSAWLE